jgi:uncharacterized protein (TIGR03435 family)
MIGMLLRSVPLGILVLITASAQTFPARPAFEVESVRLSKSSAMHSSVDVAEGGVVSFHNITMVELITAAYNKRENAMAGVPAWFRSDQFDIVAKGPSQMKESDLSVRLQSLLATEFKLAIHEEQRPIQAFAMVPAKKGGAAPQTAPGPGSPACKRGGTVDTLVLDCESITMENLIGPLTFVAQDYLDRPVVDLTGLKGTFRVRLEWVPQRLVDTNGGVTLFAAFEKQLGLKLEARKVPASVLVIDHVERLAL